MPPRLLHAESLKVSHDLVGSELASPVRRAAAFAVDYLLLIVPTAIVALLWVGTVMWFQDRPALNALVSLVRLGKEDSEGRLAAFRDLAPLLVRLRAEGLPWKVYVAVADGDLDRAAAILGADKNLLIAISHDSGSGEVPHVESDPDLIRVPLERLLPQRLRWLSIYGVALLYFAIFARGRRGATFGKRMLGIGVVRLDRRRLSLWEGVERFVAYLSVPGTLGFGLIDLWRDPNRRLAHDRVANTAVIRLPVASRKRKTQSGSQAK